MQAGRAIRQTPHSCRCKCVSESLLGRVQVVDPYAAAHPHQSDCALYTDRCPPSQAPNRLFKATSVKVLLHAWHVYCCGAAAKTFRLAGAMCASSTWKVYTHYCDAPCVPAYDFGLVKMGEHPPPGGGWGFLCTCAKCSQYTQLQQCVLAVQRGQGARIRRKAFL